MKATKEAERLLRKARQQARQARSAANFWAKTNGRLGCLSCDGARRALYAMKLFSDAFDAQILEICDGKQDAAYYALTGNEWGALNNLVLGKRG